MGNHTLMEQPSGFTFGSMFCDQTVEMSEVDQFVIEKTDFLPRHARTILTEREHRYDISVIPKNGYKRRKGTFKAGKVKIQFRKRKGKLF